MKILMLSTHLNPGGITSYIYNLSRGLILKGHKIAVISSGGIKSADFSGIGVKVIDLNIKTKSELSPKLWMNIGEVIKIINDEKVDLIHAHTRVTQVLSQLASNKTKKPYVSTCHGFFKPRWLRKHFGCWGDKVIAISEAVKEHLINDFKVPAGKIEMVYNGIDLSRFKAVSDEQKKLIKQKFGLPDKPTIGIIARLSDIKGHEYLIKAFKQVLDRGFDAQLFIVGEGPMKSKLDKLIKDLAVGDKIYFQASVADTSEPLEAIDIFCMPSIMEGLGLAVIEAQAKGVPVVVSRVGGLTSLVKDGETGLMVESQNPQVLAQALIRLLRSQDLAQNLAKKAKLAADSKFSLNDMVDKMEAIYKRLI